MRAAGRHLRRPAPRRLARRRRARTDGDVDARAHVERLLAALAPGAALVTVLDGHPATLSWLGAVAGHRVVALGVDRFGQSGDIPDLYREYGLDARAIVDAAARHLPRPDLPERARDRRLDRLCTGGPPAMPTEIRMPRLTDTMTEGAIVAWRKREGDPVRSGEAIAEIEADKTTVDLEAPEDGTLARIVVPAGAEKVKVGAVLAVLHRPGESATSVAGEVAAAARPHRTRTTGIRSRPPTATTCRPAATAPRAEPTAAPALAEVKASPLARSMAMQAGLDLSSLRGSGPQGRIVKADVLAALGLGTGLGAPLPPPVAATGPELLSGRRARTTRSPTRRCARSSPGGSANRSGRSLTSIWR